MAMLVASHTKWSVEKASKVPKRPQKVEKPTRSAGIHWRPHPNPDAAGDCHPLCALEGVQFCFDPRIHDVFVPFWHVCPSFDWSALVRSRADECTGVVAGANGWPFPQHSTRGLMECGFKLGDMWPICLPDSISQSGETSSPCRSFTWEMQSNFCFRPMSGVGLVTQHLQKYRWAQLSIHGAKSGVEFPWLS